MSHSYIVYIDESGDDGLAKFRNPGASGGASHWLVIGACIVRASRDLELVTLRDSIKSECAPQKQGRSIHFKDFNHNQKRRAAQIISGKPVRFAVVAGLKTAPEASVFAAKNQLYFYLTRYLIERVSWLCRDLRPLVREGDGRAKIIFSRRGGLSYDGFKEYLRRLRDSPETSVHWPTIDIEAVEAQDHSRKAGLQIADCGVSAVAAALEKDVYGNVEGTYIRELAGNIYNRNGNYLSYGLKLLPNIEKAHLDPAQTEILLRFR
ncbi:DUF3800 domain-containing protein [Frigidibacter sp. RF13]|uniref:DUF3800 domain-containing protein n=1 Tax=Frigidibacter sp. RF13 TaxID=2997340 RepID=UPI00226FE197|nr:DUF3800 domain-containing protein [Frigidibacter sp. RF13]MCY1126908.1 DUF3800 domain-containing protein [Frigidibacter sp. RF13]